jgi:hypothetical protein
VADLLQFLAKTPVQPRASFYSSGALTDLDGPAGGTCTVAVTLPDGSPGPASGTVSHVSTGIYSFELAGPADPTVYDIAWSGEIGGKPVQVDTQAEALGELLFNLGDLRELRVGNGKPFAATAVPNFTDEQLQEARTATLEEFQQILWHAPVPRYARTVAQGDGSKALRLPHYKVQRVLAASIDGTALSADELADLYVDDRWVVRKTLGVWPATEGSVTVSYVHGWERVEGDGSNIAMLRAAMRLIPGLADAASSVTTPDGTSISFDPAGQVTRAGRVRHFGVPAIDSWLNRWAVA